MQDVTRIATNHHNYYFASGILQNILKVCRPGSLHFVAYPGKNRADFPVLDSATAGKVCGVWLCFCIELEWNYELWNYEFIFDTAEQSL